MAKIKTSAIKDYNAAVVKQSGRVGTVRYYSKNGLTYVRAASNSQVTNTRTNAQMTQRLKFASLSALYSTLGTHLKGAFPNKAKNQNDYNAFMQANQGDGVYMDKQSRALGYSVALPVVVASGKLSAVTSSIQSGKLVSDLNIGSLAVASAKVSELSAAIIAGNEGWNYGDQLTIVVLRQVGTFCRPQYVRIVLDRNNETLVNAYGTFSTVSGCLAYAATGDVCAGFIHSSSEGGMSYCKLTASDSMTAVIEGYLTDDAFAAASASYGTSAEKFLIPKRGSGGSNGASGSNGSNGSNGSSGSNGSGGSTSGGSGAGTGGDL